MRTTRVFLATLAALGMVLVTGSPASAATTIAASPATDLVTGDTVHVTGTGMPANREIYVCQGVISASPEIGIAAATSIPS
jgi:hypothetical protein